MEDHPRNQAEFESRFGTEAACREYIICLRWHQGFVCPCCNPEGGWADPTAGPRDLRGKLFYRLLQNAVRTPATPYRTMVKALRGGRKKKHNI